MAVGGVPDEDAVARTRTTATLKLSPFLRPINVQPAIAVDNKSSKGEPLSRSTARSTGTQAAPSSFALVPPAALNSLAQFRIVLDLALPRVLSTPIYEIIYRYLPPGLGTDWEQHSPALFAFLGDLRGGHGSDAKWGYAKSFGIVVFAILANHVRRIFFVESAVGGYEGPIGMLKLAAGSPELFLGEEFERGVSGRSCGLAKIAADAAGTFAGFILLKGVRRLEGAAGATRKSAGFGSEIRATTAAAVLVLVWGLGAAEYLHARIAHVVAVGIAYWRMARGGEVFREALWRIFFVPEGSFPTGKSGVTRLFESFVAGFWANEDKFSIIGFHAELLFYLAYGVCPLLKLALLAAVGLGRVRGGRGKRSVGWVGPAPGLALVIGGWAWLTGHVARYSNKYFIGLQMYEMVLVGWWIGLAGCAFGWMALREKICRTWRGTLKEHRPEE